jgi:hypothetical protein
MSTSKWEVTDPANGRIFLRTDDEYAARRAANGLVRQFLIGEFDRRQNHELRKQFDQLLARILTEVES